MAKLLLLLVGLMACVLMAAIGIGLWLESQPSPQAPGITVDNFKRIKKGMPYSQVNDILGDPSPLKWYDRSSAGFVVWRSSECNIRLHFHGSEGRLYVSDGECIDSDGQVMEVPRPPETIFDALRR
jgi:hypothetical protein